MYVGRWQSGQMQRAVNPPTKVYVGSNPALPILDNLSWHCCRQSLQEFSRDGSLAQLARAPALQAGGQGFESLRIQIWICL